MNTDNYNPVDDENQGVAGSMMRAEKATYGVPQTDYMGPVTNQGPEPEKAEVNDSDSEANGINDDVLAEEEVEAGSVDEEE